MYPCLCGESTKDAGGQCARCVALRTLDLSFEATEEQIEAARNTFVKVWHPDRFEHDESLRKVAEEKMRAINAAYRFLTLTPTNDYKPKNEPVTAGEAQVEPAPHRAFPNRWQLFSKSFRGVATVLAIVAVVAGLCLIGFLAKEFDSYITGAPVVGEQYSNLKFFIGAKLHEATGNTWNHSGEGLHSLIPDKGSPAPAATAKADVLKPNDRLEDTPRVQRVQESYAARPEHEQPEHAQPDHVKALPYITAGLSKADVIAIEGAPNLATEDKLTYGRTEFYFSDDKLSGWKIDPTSTSARVKLWPESAVDPNLQSFTVGSTKDQVLVVQGTPTLFADDKFGYGGSEVFFQNDRVIGWKADPGSIPLRAVSQ